MKTNEFTDLVQSKTSEELADILLRQKSDYQQDFIDAVAAELEERNINVDELLSAPTPEKLIYQKKTDDELIEIFLNPDEHTEPEIDFVRQEITARNLPLEALTKRQQNNRWQNDNQKDANGCLVTFGFISCFFGGLLGVIIALTLLLSTIKNKEGEYIPKYNEATRKTAKIMLIIAAIVSCIALFVGLFN